VRNDNLTKITGYNRRENFESTSVDEQQSIVNVLRGYKYIGVIVF